MFLLIPARMAAVICTSPAITVSPFSQCWRASILATILAVPLALIIVTLALRYPDETIIQFSPRIVGRPLGRLVGLVYILFFMLIAAVDIRVFGEMFTTIFLPETPISAIMILMMVAVTYGVFSGLEVLARAADLLVPVIFAGVYLVLLLVIGEIQIVNLTPHLVGGLPALLAAAATPTALFGEVVVVTMLVPFVNNPRAARGAAVLAVLIVGITFVLVTATATAVLGDIVASRQIFPFLKVARQVSIAEFIERIESVLVLIFAAIWFIKTGLFFYVSALALGQWLNLKSYRPVVLPLAPLLIGLSIWLAPNMVEFVRLFRGAIYFPLTMGPEFLIPAGLLVIDIIRRGRRPASGEMDRVAGAVSGEGGATGGRS